jgi:hypothetical protein
MVARSGVAVLVSLGASFVRGFSGLLFVITASRPHAQLEESGFSHPQIAEFRRACRKAQDDGCVLTISGDMHPEL